MTPRQQQIVDVLNTHPSLSPPAMLEHGVRGPLGDIRAAVGTLVVAGVIEGDGFSETEREHAYRLTSAARLSRRMELVFGGPQRPFPLTVKEADLLRSACETHIEECLRTNVEIPPEDDTDRESDADTLETLRALKDRLLIHSGYSPEKVAGAGAKESKR